MTFDKSNAFVSGEPGTTGREPFEQSSTGGVGVSHIQHGQQGHVHDNNCSYQEGSYPEGSSGLSGAIGASHIQHGQQGHVHDNNCSYQEGSSATSGLGQGHQGHHHSGHTGGVTGDNYGSAGGVGTGRQFDQTGNTKADSETGASHHTGHHGQGTGHGLAAAAASATGATGAGHNNHHHSGADVGVDRQEGSALSGSGYDSNNQRDSSNYGNDRVGALGQNSGAYERTGADGPTTTGAAGTDRFDTDRSRTGNAGSGAGFGPGGERHTEYGGNTATGYGGQNDVDKREKAAGTGGIGGLLTTTDKEFTGRDRLGGAAGAYGDETGPFKGNKDGPGNNTALTGREGNEATNPVANDSSKDVHTTRPSDSTTGTTDAHHDGEKKGIVEKIKGALF